MSKTRSREHRIVIRASVPKVWEALTDPGEIARWYAPEVRVEPGADGRFWLSWGGGLSGTSRILVWKPGAHLRLVHDSKAPVTEDFFLERDGDSTVLRLVQSEIPEDADWDDFYEETNRGWKMFLAGLRHYLERHFGEARANVTFMQPIRISIEEAWDKLLGAEGLAATGSLDALTVGRRQTVTTAFGQELETEVVVHEPPFTLSMIIDNLEDSLLALDFEHNGRQTFLYANLSTFTLDPAQVEELRRDWRAWIERLFPSPGGGEV